MPKTKAEVEAEVAAINKIVRERKAHVLPCRECNGEGYKNYPIYGDWRLGSERMQCSLCNGTGNRIKFKS